MDYNEILSLAFWHTFICILWVLVVTLNIESEKLNVKTAFLHGRLEGDILMHQLKGFEVEGKENYGCVLKRCEGNGTCWEDSRHEDQEGSRSGKALFVLEGIHLENFELFWDDIHKISMYPSYSIHSSI